jgi:hypothetical protein
MTIEEKAIKEYGITDSFYDAGYILPDGQLLDYSEGRGMGRTQDHRNVCQFFKYDPSEYAVTTKQMVKFMKRGNIRVMPESNCIEFYKLPTKEQYKAIKYIASDVGAHNMIIEQSSKNGMHSNPIGDFYDFKEWLAERADYNIY